MTQDEKRAKNVYLFLSLPFDGDIRVLENRISIWTDIEDERVEIYTHVFKSDTVGDVQARLIDEWDLAKDRIRQENEEWEDPSETQGYPGDSLTL